MNNQPSHSQIKPSVWNAVVSLLKKYWWVYPLMWIFKLAGIWIVGAYLYG